jgi:N-acyl-D-amino-acid deacylase
MRRGDPEVGMGRIGRVPTAAVLFLAIGWSLSGQEPASVLIRNAMVLDGTGAAARRADVRIAADRIADVGQLSPQASDRIVDAGGLTLAPGFIDTHSHHDRGLAERPDALAAVSQGITTIVVGQDGGSAFPLATFFESVRSTPPAVNVASYVGHGTLRRRVLGTDYKRPSTDDEVTKMRELLRTEMAAGALGLSTGLEYDPGIYSTPQEVIALAKDAAAMGGRYMSHIRSEDRHFWKAVDEVIAIGREARLPVHISHVKLAMRNLWGQSDKLIQVLDRARKDGVELTADIYPYTYWQSGATVLFPERNYDDRAEAELVLKEVVAPDDLLFTSFPPNPAYAGRTLAQISAERKTDPASTLLNLIKEAEAADTSASVVATSMDEKDVADLMRWPFANICSDGAMGGGHPRGFGAFPRVLGVYVRERGVLPIPEAVRKMTSLAAANAGIKDRGRIASGQFADLVLFDPRSVVDRATTTAPQTVSLGINRVWVNGVEVFRDGTVTKERPGLTLRGR